MTKNSLSSYMGNANLPTLDANAMADAMDNDTADASNGGGDVSFVQFSGKHGRYSVGRDKDEMDPEAKFVLDPSGNRRGFICWKGSKPVDRVSWSIFAPEQAVDEVDLEDHGPYKKNSGDGWSVERAFIAKGLDGMQISFSTSSVSGNNAIADLWNEISGRMRAAEPFFPVISFDMEEFTAQEKKNYKPVFVIEAWVTAEAAGAYFEDKLSEKDLLAGKMPRKIAARKKPAAKKK